LRAHLVGLNTALLSYSSNDEGELIADIGALQHNLNSARQDTDLVFCVGHHPISYLAQWNGNTIEALLRANHALYLHGHDHTHIGPNGTVGAGEGLVSLSAGSAYAGSYWPQYIAMYRCGRSSIDFETKIFS
ncbi:MAG: hypothetical protein ABSE72_08005, partial [Bacteroidales bacterium]